MSYVPLTNVLQSCSAPGTSAFASLTAITGRDTFAARMSNGDTGDYLAIAVNSSTLVPTGNWERGVGTWVSASSSISRSPVYSNNADGLVNFTDSLVYLMGVDEPSLPDYVNFLNADYTLTSTTSAQKIFNNTANGALTLQPGLYALDAELYVTTMSATSGNAAFALLGAGTATLGNLLYTNYGVDSTTPLAAVAQTGSASVSATSAASIVVGATGTGMVTTIKGMFVVTAAGTIIPSIALVTANAAVVKAGSHIRIKNLAKASTYYSGPWS